MVKKTPPDDFFLVFVAVASFVDIFITLLSNIFIVP